MGSWIRPGLRVCRIGALALTVLTALVVGCSSDAADAAEAERIAELLELRPGMRVADVGAGDGEWTVDLARRVGGAGHVWATEVKEEHLAEIRERVEEAGLHNVTVARGDQTTNGLPDACCDAILLRLVYHHFTDPARMRRELVRALRPGGIVAVIDIEPQEHWRKLEGVPERGGHGIPAEELIAEMAQDGFRVLRRQTGWNGDEDRYGVVFGRGKEGGRPRRLRSSGPAGTPRGEGEEEGQRPGAR